ncbi:MAG: biotin--[acetyl-CoA-carboxylase] ligase [Bacteroidota bacterium]|nr:biotin--[acetyl-CoA-carboxylase] ligase [Bacteroidota bacterium]
MPTLFSNIIILNQTNSTNAYAIDLLKSKKAKEGTVIFANFQTNGEGQRGENWESDYDKNILMSMVLSPNIPVNNQFDITICISLALFNLLKRYIKEGVKIKWPNDILIADKKIAGILIQNFVNADKVKDVIVGIGLNINQKKFPDFSTQATSLALELEKEFDVLSLQKDILKAVEQSYLQFGQGKIDKMKAEYLTNLYGFKNWREYKIQNKKIKAKIFGIDESGRVILQFKDAYKKAFSLKEIKYLI